MAYAKKMLMDIIKPTVEKQYGGGLDDAYMTLSQRRSSAFADPNANSAFASPMSQGGLPTVYRQDPGSVGTGDEDWSDYDWSSVYNIKTSEGDSVSSEDLGDGNYFTDPGLTQGQSPVSAAALDPSPSSIGNDQPPFTRTLLEPLHRLNRAEERRGIINFWKDKDNPLRIPSLVKNMQDRLASEEKEEKEKREEIKERADKYWHYKAGEEAKNKEEERQRQHAINTAGSIYPGFNILTGKPLTKQEQTRAALQSSFTPVIERNPLGFLHGKPERINIVKENVERKWAEDWEKKQAEKEDMEKRDSEYARVIADHRIKHSNLSPNAKDEVFKDLNMAIKGLTGSKEARAIYNTLNILLKGAEINRKTGGGLSTIPRERMINNQPHQLSYINPQEAGLLQALGGSGRRVDGVPAYFWSADTSGYDTGGDEGSGQTDFSEETDWFGDAEEVASRSEKTGTTEDLSGVETYGGPVYDKYGNIIAGGGTFDPDRPYDSGSGKQPWFPGDDPEGLYYKEGSIPINVPTSKKGAEALSEWLELVGERELRQVMARPEGLAKLQEAMKEGKVNQEEFNRIDAETQTLGLGAAGTGFKTYTDDEWYGKNGMGPDAPRKDIEDERDILDKVKGLVTITGELDKNKVEELNKALDLMTGGYRKGDKDYRGGSKFEPHSGLSKGLVELLTPTLFKAGINIFGTGEKSVGRITLPSGKTFEVGDKGSITADVPLDEDYDWQDTPVSKKKKPKKKLKPEQKTTAAKEVAKTPKKVLDTLFKKGLFYPYLALINAGYTVEKAIRSIGAEEGIPLGGPEETELT